MKIKSLDAYTIFDSRGVPTIEAEIVLENGLIGRGIVPSGASTGQFEALELRDGDQTRFHGKSVEKAIGHIRHDIAPLICGQSVFDQRELDHAMCELDGTPNKSRLGANAILATSMALANSAALAAEIPLYQRLGSGTLLPLPEIQLIGGGAHAQWRTDVQDFLLIANGAKSYAQTLEMTANVYHTAGRLLKEYGLLTGIADEGGFWPNFATHEEILDFIVDAIAAAGYVPGQDISLSLDIAASDLLHDGRYRFALEQREFTPDQFRTLISGWCERYPIISIEDPFADTDQQGWIKFTNEWGNKIQIIGDDLFTTNPARISQGIESKMANSVLIKLNQIGTVSETLDAIALTQQAGWRPVVSARSGETEDAFISHLAVGTAAGQLKVGSFARSERMVKWNEVLRISRQLGDKALFSGADIFRNS